MNPAGVIQGLSHGLQVKIVTGDHVAIAKETSRQLGLGTDILSAEQVFAEDPDLDHLAPQTVTKIEGADGTALLRPGAFPLVRTENIETAGKEEVISFKKH